MSIITSAELATYIGISDTVDNSNLDWAATAANQDIQSQCGRTFDKTPTSAPTARVYRPDDRVYVTTHDFWDTTVLVVKTDDAYNGTYATTWILNTDYIIEPLNRRLADGSDTVYTTLTAVGNRRFFPMNTVNLRPPIQVTAAWGWEILPQPVKLAALIHGHRLFKRRDSPEGVLGGFADFTALRVSNRVDPDVAILFAPYTRLAITSAVA